MSVNLPEEELSCPVCCEIFQDPVLLPCSHSFCRKCLDHFWRSTSFRTCPVCRRRTSKKSPASNRALKNLCEAALLEKSGLDSLCKRHGEKLKLFCLVDQEPICVVCQASKLHKHHDCSPTEEAALDCKDKLSDATKKLREKLEVFSRARRSSAFMLEHVKHQARCVERQMKEEFLKLHQFLHEEEERRLAAVKEEEERKTEALKKRDDEDAQMIMCLSDMIAALEKATYAEDLILLQNFKTTNKGTCSTLKDPERVPGFLLDECKHLGNLKFRVWEKMQTLALYSPVILDPNTAHPCVTLSDDLTALHYNPVQTIPETPERFRLSAEVLGGSAFSGGAHSWDVQVGENEDWILGLASEGVKRDQEVPARPENGFWTLCQRDGQYRAMTSPPSALSVKEKLQRIRVHLNWDSGHVSFSNPECGEDLFTFHQAFTDKLRPYFYTQGKHPLRILPKPVSVSVG